jgi:hypothetical protein
MTFPGDIMAAVMALLTLKNFSVVAKFVIRILITIELISSYANSLSRIFILITNTVILSRDTNQSPHV